MDDKPATADPAANKAADAAAGVDTGGGSSHQGREQAAAGQRTGGGARQQAGAADRLQSGVKPASYAGRNEGGLTR